MRHIMIWQIFGLLLWTDVMEVPKWFVEWWPGKGGWREGGALEIGLYF